MVESTQNQDSNLGSRLQQDLKNDLIAGLLVVIPLATTIWLSSLVSKFVLTLVTSVPKQLNPFITLNPILQDLINPKEIKDNSLEIDLSLCINYDEVEVFVEARN